MVVGGTPNYNRAHGTLGTQGGQGAIQFNPSPCFYPVGTDHPVCSASSLTTSIFRMYTLCGLLVKQHSKPSSSARAHPTCLTSCDSKTAKGPWNCGL